MPRKIKPASRSASYLRSWVRPGFFMCLPAILILITFIFVPLFLNIGFSLTNYSVNNPAPRFVGLQNFINIFNDPNVGLIFNNTLKLALVYVVGLNLLAILVSVLLMKVSYRFATATKTILYVPCLLAMVVVGFIFRVLFSYKNGPINYVLRGLGLPNGLIPEWLGDPRLVIITVGLTIIWYALGYYTVIYYNGQISISQEMYEAARVDGANQFQEFRFVTIPLLAPTITINVVLTTIAIIGSFDLPTTLTNGGGPGRFGTTVSMWIYQLYFENHQYGKSIALSVILSAIGILAALVELKTLRSKEVQQ